MFGVLLPPFYVNLVYAVIVLGCVLLPYYDLPALGCVFWYYEVFVLLVWVGFSVLSECEFSFFGLFGLPYLLGLCGCEECSVVLKR